jgi:hypothetical protein
MLGDATNQTTRREWRELGFFNNRNDELKTWRLYNSTGSESLESPSLQIGGF